MEPKLVVVLCRADTHLFRFYCNSLVERRQNIVMRTAVASSAIVSSIFPEVVRERLYQSAQTGKRNATNEESELQFNLPVDNDVVPSETAKVHPKRVLKNLMVTSEQGEVQSASNSFKGYDMAKPIADLFTDCTVIFADIAGFTAW